MQAQQRIGQIQKRLGRRRLVFFGTRGTDAKPLLKIPSFDAVFSQIAPLQALGIEETCLETLKGLRVDLNRYSVDADPAEEVRKLRAELLGTFGSPAAVVPYRPSEVLAAAWFPRADRVEYFGVFHEKQTCFEHKPWVETQLQRHGVRVIPWCYYSDDDHALILEAVEAGPLVLRSNRSDGGAGLEVLRPASDIKRRWPAHGDGFLAASPLLDPSLPLNVSACVYPGGEVVLHVPSVQLIGLDQCTNRTFGYCGNDFACVADLDGEILDDLQAMTHTVGRWLASQGYLGAFGLDALLFEGSVYLVEINPRFQGSSLHAAEIFDRIGRPNIYLDHIAAFMGLEPPAALSLRELARLQAEEPLSHVVCYNKKPAPVCPLVSLGDAFAFACTLLPAPHVSVAPEGTLLQITFPCSVTDDGFSLTHSAAQSLGDVLQTAYHGATGSFTSLESHSSVP